MSKLTWDDLPEHTKEAARRGAARGALESGKPGVGAKSAPHPRGADPRQPKRKAWSNAKRSRVSFMAEYQGRTSVDYEFRRMSWPVDSGLEQVVILDLLAGARGGVPHGHEIAVKVTYPLSAFGRRDDDGAFFRGFTPDISILDASGKLVRVLEPKGRKGKDYPLRRDAFQAEYHVTVEEISK